METYLSIENFVAYIKAAMFLWMMNILFRQEWKSLTVFNTFRSRTYRIAAAVCGETAADFLHNNKANGPSTGGRLAYRYAASFTFDDYQTDYEIGRILDGRIQTAELKVWGHRLAEQTIRQFVLWLVNMLFRLEWKSLTVFNIFRSRIYRVKVATCGKTAADFFHNNKANGPSATGRLAYRYAASFPFDEYQTDYELGAYMTEGYRELNQKFDCKGSKAITLFVF